MYRLTRLTEPTTEPITIDEAVAHLRIDSPDSTETALLSAMISAARDRAERYCNRAWAQADFIETLNTFPSGGIQLTDPGVVSVSRIDYLDSDGTVGTIAGSSLTLDDDLGVVDYGVEWPTGATRVKVFYTAGPDAGASVPELPPPAVIIAIKLILTDMYEHRGAQQWQSIYPNNTAEQFLHMYRVGLGV